jgi:tetratricopeptide (TPR) repeat protein
MNEKNYQNSGNILNEIITCMKRMVNGSNNFEAQEVSADCFNEIHALIAKALGHEDGSPIDHSGYFPSEEEIEYDDYIESIEIRPQGDEINGFQNAIPQNQVNHIELENKSFQRLKKKYNVEFFNDPDNRSLLYSILFDFDHRIEISEVYIDWLKRNNLHILLSEILYKKYMGSDDPWDLAKACSSFRKCGKPDRVIEITEGVNPPESKSSGAILTTRGGAFRDLKNFNYASKCALEAIDKNPVSRHPYNLMGGICFDTGNFSEGLSFFLKAQDLGAKQYTIDREIKASFNKEHVDRNKLADILYQYDPNRFNWVSNHLNNAPQQSLGFGF